MRSQFFLCLLAISALPFPAIADNPANQEMMEIVITSGSRMDDLDLTLPASYRVISGEEIRSSGAASISEVLQNEAGIQMKDFTGDGTQATISMRGFGGNAHGNTLILLNGRKLNNSLDIAPARLTEIAMQDIDRIEVVSGSAGVLYGESAVGGIVNIITRPMQDELVEVSAETGSYDHEAYSLRVHKKLSPGLRLRLGAEHFYTDNYRLQNRHRNKTLNAGLEYDRDADRLYIDWSSQNQDLELPGSLTLAQRNANRRLADSNFSESNTDADAIRIGWHHSGDSPLQTAIDGSWRQDDINGALNIFGAPCTFTQERSQWSFTPRASYQLGSRDSNTKLITGWDHDAADYHFKSCAGDQFADQRNDSIYLQLQLALRKDLEFIAGMRRVWSRTDFRDTGGFAVFPGGESYRANKTVHDLGIEWRPTEQTRFFLRRAENFRFAKVDEHTNQFGANLQALEAQTGTSWETGGQWSTATTQLGLSAYHLELKDEIAYDASNFVNRNLDPTRRIGWQLDYQQALGDQLDLKISHAQVDARFRAGANKGNRIPFVAPRNTTIGLHGSVNEHLESGAEYLRISDRDADSDDSNRQAEVKGHERVDLFLNYSRNRFAFNLRLNNALNEEYDGYGTAPFGPTVYYPAPERNLSMRVTWKM